jgi:HEAT repeat protein
MPHERRPHPEPLTQPHPGWTLCPLCGGTRCCRFCDGQGWWEQDPRGGVGPVQCMWCRGRGSCSSCRGAGELWESPPSGDWPMRQSTVDQFLEQLQSAEEPWQRYDAAKALGQLGDARAVAPLLACLHDPESPVRWGAVQALGQLGDARAVAPLLASCCEPGGLISTAADAALRQLSTALGSAAFIAAVEPALQHADPCVRTAAARALYLLRDGRAVAPLLTCLRDQEASVRVEAIGHLAWMGDVRAVAPLIACLHDEDPWVAENAASALGKLGNSRAVEPLIACLERAHSRVRPAAVRALMQLGDARAVEPLLVCLHDPDPVVSQYAAEALLHLGDVRAVEPVLTWIYRHEQGIYIVVDALTYQGERRVVAPLLARLQAQEPDLVREATLQALTYVGDVSTFEPLVACLQGEGATVRAEVAAALGRLGDARAVEPLRVCLHDPARVVRAAARAALRALGASADGTWGESGSDRDAQMQKHPCYIAFRVRDEVEKRRLAALRGVFRALKRAKDRQIAAWEAGEDGADYYEEADDSDWVLYHPARTWRSYFDARALSHFRQWASLEEHGRFLEEWQTRPRLIRDHIHPRDDAPWDLTVLLRSIEQSELRLIACRVVGGGEARLEFEALAYPYGGTGCLKALIAAFDLLVIGEDDGFGYYAYDEPESI